MNDKFSKIGYILAVAGSAVGLGNAWKFPTMVGNNGGSAFIVLYLFLTFAIAFVAFLAELAIGRLGQTDMVGSFSKLAVKNKNAWSKSGIFMVGAVLIVSFYMVVIGWILKYVFISFASLPSDTKSAAFQFDTLVKNDAASAIICFSMVFFMVFYVVSKGIKNGIEKLNVFMMPSLFVLLLIMLAYSLSMGDGFVNAAKFLFIPNFSAITGETVLMALGLAFFSLSMGTGTIPTYAASIGDDTNLIKSTLSIIFINILVGIMMGLVVFTFIFTYGGDTTQGGPGLIFVSLTTLFAKLGFVGNLLAIAFFVLLLFAGITSAVSMIEPFAFYLINKFNFSRLKAILYIGIFVYILGIACLLSYYEPLGDYLSLFGKPIFDNVDYLTSNIMMPLGAITFSIFIGFAVKKELLFELYTKFMSAKCFEIWYFLLRFFVPVAVLAIMIYQILK
ncbi:MAG: sodium-dependent transporter [Campylobacter sp.]